MFVGRSITVIRAHYSSLSTNHCRQQHLMPLSSSSTRRKHRLPRYTHLAGSLNDWLPRKNGWPTVCFPTNSLFGLFKLLRPTCFLSIPVGRVFRDGVLAEVNSKYSSRGAIHPHLQSENPFNVTRFIPFFGGWKFSNRQNIFHTWVCVRK